MTQPTTTPAEIAAGLAKAQRGVAMLRSYLLAGTGSHPVPMPELPPARSHMLRSPVSGDGILTSVETTMSGLYRIELCYAPDGDAVWRSDWMRLSVGTSNVDILVRAGQWVRYRYMM